MASVFFMFLHGCMTGRFKVLTLSVLLREEYFKRGDTTKTSGNAQIPGKATIPILRLGASNNTRLREHPGIQAVEKHSLCSHDELYEKVLRQHSPS